MSEFLAAQKGQKRPEIAMPPLAPEQEAVIESAPQITMESPDIPQDIVVESPKVEQVQQEAAQAKNFRELREKAERASREAQQAQQERDALVQRIKELESLAQSKDDFSLAPDDLVEGKHLSRHIKELKEVKDELNRYRQQTHQQSIESQLRSQYTDFDTVVTKDSLETLAPAVQQSLKVMAQTDLKAAGEAAYELLRSRQHSFATDAALVQKNVAKPRPLTSMSPQQGDSPLSKANAFANGLTPELQKQLLKEMEAARKGY